MPTHWESSEGPLFVKTVIVNGNRHAILSQVDPLRQSRKVDASSTICHGCTSPSSIAYLDARDDLPMRRARSCYQPKKDITSDLQNCLVKLRVALSTQEKTKKVKKDEGFLKAEEQDQEERSEMGARSENWMNVRRNLGKVRKSAKTGDGPKEIITGFKKGNSYSSMLEYEDECCRDSYTSALCGGSTASTELEIEYPLASKSDRTNLVKRMLPLSDATEQLLKNYSGYFFPIVYLKTNPMTWDEVAGDGCVAKNFNNPLSERVLQWLELARRRKESLTKKSEENEKVDQTIPTNSNCIKKLITRIHNRKQKAVRCRYENKVQAAAKEQPIAGRKATDGDEDVEEEVKQECDVETVLSLASPHDWPKFSRELNRQHVMKEETCPPLIQDVNEEESLCDEYWSNSLLSIPEKSKSDYSITEQLQQSILNSFEAVVNLERSPALDSVRFVRKQSLRESGNLPDKLSWRKGLLIKQTNIRISSDEEEHAEGRFSPDRRDHYSYRNNRNLSQHRKKVWESKKKYRNQRMSLNDENREPSEGMGTNRSNPGGGKKVWAVEKGGNKPQLHIFMPEVSAKAVEPGEESGSDAET